MHYFIPKYFKKQEKNDTYNKFLKHQAIDMVLIMILKEIIVDNYTIPLMTQINYRLII